MTSVAPIGTLTVINGNPSADQRVPGAAVDTNYQLIRQAVNDLLVALSVTIRDDNLLADGAVRLRSLDLEVSTVIASQGWQPKVAVHAATTAALSANTVNVGAGTLTANANGAFPAVDGVASVLNNDYIVKDEVAQANNGIYRLTQLGNGGAPWILTRRTDADTAAEIGYAATSVVAGTVNGARAYVVTLGSSSITLGTTAIVFAQFGSQVGTLGVASGGTGATTPGGALTNLGFSAYFQTLVGSATADIVRTLLLLPSQAMAARTVIANDTTGTANGSATTIDSLSLLATGSVTRRTLGARAADVVNVKDFGALGDGTTNDTPAFVLAFAALPATGGIVIVPPTASNYRVNLNFTNNPKDITLQAYGAVFKPFVTTSPIITCDNTAFGAAHSRCEVIGATLDANSTANVAVNLVQTSGIILRKCLVQNALVYGVLMNYGQYCRFIECVFTLCNAAAGSYGVYSTGPNGNERSNELWFERCQFFTNTNHCHIGGGEGCRFYACTFQDQRYIAGCTGGLVIAADAGGNGSRKTTVDGCYFEINQYIDIQIGLAESVTISNCIFYDANGYSGTKIGSVYANTLYDLSVLWCRFVTASTPTLNATHNNPVYRVIGCGVTPNVAGVTGTNPYGYIEDTAQRKVFVNGGFFSNGALDVRRKGYPPKTLINVNSAATDVTTFTGLPVKYRILRFFAFDASISLTTATVDLRTAAGGGGGAIVSAQALSPLTAANKIADLTIAAGAITDYRTEATLYVRNVTAQGVAATCSFGLEIEDLTP